MKLGYVIFIERSINKKPRGDRNCSVSDSNYGACRGIQAMFGCRLDSFTELHIEIVVGDVKRLLGVKTLAG